MPKDIEKLNVSVEPDIQKALRWCDAVNVLRVQRERMIKSYFPDNREYSMLFGLDENKISSIKKDILILHPGPINRGVEITSNHVESNNSIILDGLWTARKVKIDINSLKSVKIVSYSRFFLNRSVYNLHFKGSIRFFTRGKDAVKLIDKDGQVYLIGSQKVEELERTIKNKLNKD